MSEYLQRNSYVRLDNSIIIGFLFNLNTIPLLHTADFNTHDLNLLAHFHYMLQLAVMPKADCTTAIKLVAFVQTALFCNKHDSMLMSLRELYNSCIGDVQTSAIKSLQYNILYCIYMDRLNLTHSPTQKRIINMITAKMH